jgi:hypothetical protein
MSGDHNISAVGDSLLSGFHNLRRSDRLLQKGTANSLQHGTKSWDLKVQDLGRTSTCRVGIAHLTSTNTV